MNDRITIDVRMIHSSGVGRYIGSILPFMISCSPFSFSLIGRQDELRGYDWFDSENIQIVECNTEIYSLQEQFQLLRKIPKRCNLFWSPHYNVPLLPVRAQKRLVTIHDVFHLVYFNELNLKQKIYAKLMMNAAVKLSDRIVTVSEFSKSELIKYTKVDKDKIEVVYNGVNKNRFREYEDKSRLQEVKRRLNLPERFILYVGNVKPHKNLKRLLEAFEKLIESALKDCYLVVVGKKEGFIIGDEIVFKRIESDIKLKEKVIFTGYVGDEEDLSVIYNLASLFIFPSLYEGFGLPPLEALSCGCPTVVSNIASLPEVCCDAAYYVDPYSIESIAEGMYKALTDETLRQSLIQKGLERAKLFSWERSAKEHIKIFEDVLNSPCDKENS